MDLGHADARSRSSRDRIWADPARIRGPVSGSFTWSRGNPPGEMAQPVRVRRGRKLHVQLPGIVDHAHVQSTSTQIQSSVQHERRRRSTPTRERRRLPRSCGAWRGARRGASSGPRAATARATRPRSRPLLAPAAPKGQRESGAAGVVPGRLDHQPALVSRLSWCSSPGGACRRWRIRRGPARGSRQLLGLGERLKVADLRDQPECGERVDAAHAPQPSSSSRSGVAVGGRSTSRRVTRNGPSLLGWCRRSSEVPSRPSRDLHPVGSRAHDLVWRDLTCFGLSRICSRAIWSRTAASEASTLRASASTSSIWTSGITTAPEESANT